MVLPEEDLNRDTSSSAASSGWHALSERGGRTSDSSTDSSLFSLHTMPKVENRAGFDGGHLREAVREEVRLGARFGQSLEGLISDWDFVPS